MIQVQRIYDSLEKSDGARVLVDRLWSRGISKEKAHLDLWLKEIAPSNELRTWFGHDPEKWNEFQKRYKKELEGKTELINQLKQLEKEKKLITLLYSAKDREHNNAVALAGILKRIN